MRQHQLRYCKTLCKLGSAMANVLSASRFIASLTATYFASFFFGEIWRNGNSARWKFGEMGIWRDGNSARWEFSKVGIRRNGKSVRWEDTSSLNLDMAIGILFPFMSLRHKSGGFGGHHLGSSANFTFEFSGVSG